MKKITKEYNVYEYDELSKEAQEKALAKWRENNDYFFLADDMSQRLHELLEENGIKDQNDTSKPGTKPTPVLYSLSCSQGDGAMFEGSFAWKGYSVTIKHTGHYYHENSKTIEIMDESGEQPYQEDNEKFNALYKEFNELYVKICKQLEAHGYAYIEYEDSEENFKEACEANEYTFTTEGVMDNE